MRLALHIKKIDPDHYLNFLESASLVNLYKIIDASGYGL